MNINKLLNNNLEKLKSVLNFKNSNETKVSIICTTYNHASTLKKCLDSFLEQKVDFPVQIIIHDDASTDGTVEIAREYANKYPWLIFLIEEKVNQYSIDKNRIQITISKSIKGKYVANCEGDDYWSDPYKLYLQFHLMEENQDASFCVHKVKVLNDLNGSLYSYPNFKLPTCILKSKKYQKIINSHYCFQTSSYFRRATDYIKFVNNRPLFAKLIPNGDEANLLYCGSIGKVIYIDREMSVYKKFTKTSWTLANINISIDKRIEHLERMSQGLIEFDKYSKYKFHKYVIRRYYGLQYTIANLKNDVKNLFKEKSFRHYILLRRFWLYCYCVYKYFLRK